MGAGKTTRSKVMASEENTVLISEDDWLSTLYPDEIRTLDDYLIYSSRLKTLIAPHVTDIKVSDDTCLERIARRRIEQPERARLDAPSVFNELNRFSQEPGDLEGLDIQTIEQEGQ